MKGNRENFWQRANQEEKTQQERFIPLTPFQLSQLVLFQEEGCYFGALGGLLNEGDQDLLTRFSNHLKEINEQLPIDKNNPLKSLGQLNGDTQIAEVLEKINSVVEVRIITGEDIATVDGFKKLPLLAQLALVQAGRGLFSQIKKFLERGGIMVVTNFKKPSPDYLKAVKKMQEEEGLTVNAAVVKALAFPPSAVKKASHQFLSVDFIPPEPSPSHLHSPGNPGHFRRIINRRLDKKVEEDYARITLLQAILSSESAGIFKFIGIGTAAIAVFEGLELLLQNPEVRPYLSSILPAILFSLHFLNKFFFPLLADAMTFYGQLKPWLKGGNFFQEIADMLRRHILSGSSTHKESAVFSFMATLTAALGSQTLKEILGVLPAAIVYNLLPFFVAASSSYQTIKMIQKSAGTSFTEAVRTTIKNNPYQIAVDTGATVTTATGIYLMGIKGLFDDPLVVGGVHGFLEHSVAAGVTAIQLALLPYNFKAWAKKEIADWMKKFANNLSQSPHQVF